MRRFKIANGISALEKDLIRRRPEEVYVLDHIDRTHGYYVCVDQAECKWALHPEALQEMEFSLPDKSDPEPRAGDIMEAGAEGTRNVD